MPSYLLESLDSLSLQKEIAKIIKDTDFLDATINTYDLEETTLAAALEDLDTYSFLTPKKVIIIKKIESLSQEDNKEDIKHLLKYIENATKDNLLIICATKLNNTLKLTKELKKSCTYIECQFNIKQFIKDQFTNYDLDIKALDLLIDYTKNDLTRLSNECLKLKDYKMSEKKITVEDVKELVEEKLVDSKDLTFAFTRALAEKDKKQALIKYQELLSHQIEPISIVGLLASQIRILYQVKVLEKKRLTTKEIATILKEKSDYRINKTKELTKYYTEEELLSLMIKLQDIDLKVKTQDVDANFLIELFILNM